MSALDPAVQEGVHRL